MTQLTEPEKEKIKSQAKGILDSFSSALDKVKIQKKEFKYKEGGFREEGVQVKRAAGFRERMFENAPSKSNDYIIAEKKKW